MKRILQIALLTLMCTAFSRADAQELFYSKEQKFTLQNADFSVVGWAGDRLYAYRASKEGYFLDAYNDSMRLLATVALDFFSKKIYETQFYTTNDAIIVLYQAVQNNKVVQYAAKLDGKARMTKKPMALDSVKVGWMSEKKQYYSSVMSADKSKIMIYRVSSRKNKKFTVNTILFDNNMDVLATGTPSFETADDVSFAQTILGNDGTLYIAGNPEDSYKKFSSNAWIFSLSADAKQLSTVALPLNGLSISSMYLRVNEITNDVYAAAYYTEGKSENVDGIVYGILPSASTAFSSFKKIPFDDNLRDASNEANKKKAFNDYEVRKIIVKNDGGFILIGENYYISTRSYGYGSGMGYYSYYNSGYANTTVREYHYGDVMILNYDKDGNRTWNNFIRKDQNSQDDGGMFSSYALLNSGSTLVFLFNDYSSSKTTLTLAAVDIEGNLQMKRMNAGRMVNADWLPRSAKQTDTKELLVPVLKKDNLCFVRVAF
jgi:hypothetical protein